MKLPSLPSLGLSLPPDDDDLSLDEDDDLPLKEDDILAEAEVPGPPALQGMAALLPAEPLTNLPSAAAASALFTGNSAVAPEPESPATQVLSCLLVLNPIAQPLRGHASLAHLSPSPASSMISHPRESLGHIHCRSGGQQGVPTARLFHAG